MLMCQTFQFEPRKQFIQLKFVETQLGLDQTLPKLNFVKSSDSGVNMSLSQLNFPKVMFSQVS